MWDLSCLTRDRAHAPALAVWSLNHWTTRKVPEQNISNNTKGELATQVVLRGRMRDWGKRVGGRFFFPLNILCTF